MTKYVELVNQGGMVLGDGSFEHLPRIGGTLILRDYQTDDVNTYRVANVEHDVQAAPNGLASCGVRVTVARDGDCCKR